MAKTVTFIYFKVGFRTYAQSTLTFNLIRELYLVIADSKFSKSPCNNANDIKNRQDLLKEIGSSDRLAFSIQALLLKFTLDLEKMLGILCRLELKQAVMQNSEQIITNFIEFSLILKIIPEPSFRYFGYNFNEFYEIQILKTLKGSKNH